MKKYFFIIILFVVACKHNPNPYIEYIEFYSTTQKIIHTQNEDLYNNVIESSVYERDALTPLFIQIVDVMHYSDSLNTKLLNMKTTVTGITHDSLIHKKSQQTVQLSAMQIHELTSQITRYNEWLIELICKKAPKGDTSKFRELIKDIKTHIPDWNNLPVCSGKKRNALEVYAVLTKLQADIEILTRMELVFLHSDWGSCFIPIERKAIAQANSQYIPLGKSYEAKIFLVGTDNQDTRFRTKIMVDSMPIPTTYSSAIYRERCTESGNHIKNGFVRIENGINSQHIDVPFRLEYETVE